MSVRCSKCGEELLGAVNRCWRCGQTLALQPEADGRPPVRVSAAGGQSEPLLTSVAGALSSAAAPTGPRRPQSGNVAESRRASMMAMGGTVASIVLGIFAGLLALLWPPAALIAVLGLAMGIWGLRSPRRNLALVGMLLCCLAIGLGTFGGVRAMYVYVKSNSAIPLDQP